MHLLDTDILSLVYKDHSAVVANLQTLPKEEVGTTIVTEIEMLRGRYDFLFKAANAAELVKAQELLVRTKDFLAKIAVIPLDMAAAQIFDRLWATKGVKKLGRADVLTASIALAHKATLVTRNLRDFKRIPNLKVVDWAD